MQNALWRVQNLPISSSLKNVAILCGTNTLHQDSPEDIVHGIIGIGHCLKNETITLISLFVGYSLVMNAPL